MPRLTLSFKLPEEQDEAELAQSAAGLHSMLYDVVQYVRSLKKYENRTELPTEEVAQKLQELLEEFRY